MSQRVVSQKIERICEGCGVSKTYELMGGTEEANQEIQNWYTVVREVFFQGQLAKLMAQSCSLACIQAAATKLVIPPQDDSQDDGIDLGALQVSRDPVIN